MGSAHIFKLTEHFVDAKANDTMKLGIFFFAGSLVMLSNGQTCPSLVWNDEFNTLNSAVWSFQTGDGCPDLCYWGNWEQQSYTASNAVVQSGELLITADNSGGQVTSARMRTRGTLAVDFTKPRRVEGRIMVAGGQGIWPAFWLMPNDLADSTWPSGGEIDIMEYIGREPNNLHGYMHYGNLWNDRGKKGGPVWMPVDPSTEYHEFAIEKTANRMDWFLDGHLYQSYSPSDLELKFGWPFDRPYYLLLNIAVGGNWAGPTDATTNFPRTMHVDYVRVYDITNGNFGHLAGEKLVRINQAGVQYCLVDNGGLYSSLSWSVPSGATFSTNGLCATVSFGTSSGYVKVTAQSSCGQRSFSIPVKVESYYVKSHTFVTPGASDEDPTPISSGSYSIVSSNPINSSPAVKYTRSIGTEFDHVLYTTTAITDANAFVTNQSKFFMSVLATTCASCAEVILQLENSNVANSGNYPAGRHSRFSAFIESTGQWERLEFTYTDRPDNSVATDDVDRLVVLFDPQLLRADEYYFSNLDFATAQSGASGSTEPLSTNQCRVKVKSEKGACNDSVNNDYYGYDGDGMTDCDDADCWATCGRAPVSEKGLCADGIDNDGDQLVDCDDPDCSIDPLCLSGESGTTATPSKAPVKAPTSAPAPPPVQALPSVPRFNPRCNLNKGCKRRGLTSGLCCPSRQGIFLNCCVEALSTEAGFCTDGIDNDGDGKIDCADEQCQNDPACQFSSPMCANNPSCSQLAGDCCPTSTGVFLKCCYERSLPSEVGYCFDNVNNDSDQDFDCTDKDCKNLDRCKYIGLNPNCRNNPGCASTGLCCPQLSGIYHSCCADSI